MTEEYYVKTEKVDKIRKTNKEALAYWNNLYAECEKAVAEKVPGSH